MKKLMMIALLSTLMLNCNPEGQCPYADEVTYDTYGNVVECTYYRDDIVDEETPFEKGWAAGYVAGWCYKDTSQGWDCFEPFVPFAPFPNFGEETFQDGYNRGFLAGHKARKQ